MRVQLPWGIFYHVEGTWREGDGGDGEERPVVPSRVQAGRKETGDPSAKSPKQQRENWIAVPSVVVSLLSLSPSLSLSLFPKRSHRRREPSSVLFQHFCRVILFNARPTLLRLNYSNSVPCSFPVGKRARTGAGGRARFSSPFSFPPLASRDFHPLTISQCVFHFAIAVHVQATYE